MQSSAKRVKVCFYATEKFYFEKNPLENSRFEDVITVKAVGSIGIHRKPVNTIKYSGFISIRVRDKIWLDLTPDSSFIRCVHAKTNQVPEVA